MAMKIILSNMNLRRSLSNWIYEKKLFYLILDFNYFFLKKLITHDSPQNPRIIISLEM